MDAAQIILIVVISILAIILIVLSIQVYFILREFRKTVTKTNKILDDTSIIAESISSPLENLSTITQGLKLGSFIAKLISGKSGHHHQEDDRGQA